MTGRQLYEEYYAQALIWSACEDFTWEELLPSEQKVWEGVAAFVNKINLPD